MHCGQAGEERMPFGVLLPLRALPTGRAPVLPDQPRGGGAGGAAPGGCSRAAGAPEGRCGAGGAVPLPGEDDA